jgi:hypothetical protein
MYSQAVYMTTAESVLVSGSLRRRPIQ